MNEKIEELLESLEVNEFIASSEILDYLNVDTTQKNFKLLKSIMIKNNFKATSYKGKKGYRKLEELENPLITKWLEKIEAGNRHTAEINSKKNEIVPVEEEKIDENDNKFLHNLDRCIDYLSHMKLNSDNIDNKVDEIINKFKKNYLFEVK